MLFITTILRAATIGETTARVYIVDESACAVRARYNVPEPPLRDRDPNPRGGMRGARGIAISDHDVFVANFSAIYRFDFQGRLRAVFSHPLCADIHDLAWHDGRLWAASTRNDLLLQFDGDGTLKDIYDPWTRLPLADLFDLSHRRALTATDFRDPRTLDRRSTDRLHLNSFSFLPCGSLALSLGHVRVNGHFESVLLRTESAQHCEVLHRNFDAQVPAHNVVQLDAQTAAHADTAAGRIIEVATAPTAASGSAHRRTILEVDPRHGFLRGLCALDARRIAVGVQNCLWLVRTDSGLVENVLALSKDPRESIHSIARA